MAALVAYNPSRLELARTAIKKDDFGKVVRKFIIAKILFVWQSKYLKSQGVSNLRLASRAVRGEPENQWAALGAAHQLAGQKPESEILVYIYESARTYFSEKS